MVTIVWICAFLFSKNKSANMLFCILHCVHYGVGNLNSFSRHMIVHKQNAQFALQMLETTFINSTKRRYHIAISFMRFSFLVAVHYLLSNLLQHIHIFIYIYLYTLAYRELWPFSMSIEIMEESQIQADNLHFSNAFFFLDYVCTRNRV